MGVWIMPWDKRKGHLWKQQRAEIQIEFIDCLQILKKASMQMHNNPELAVKFIFMSKERKDCWSCYDFYLIFPKKTGLIPREINHDVVFVYMHKANTMNIWFSSTSAGLNQFEEIMVED